MHGSLSATFVSTSNGTSHSWSPDFVKECDHPEVDEQGWTGALSFKMLATSDAHGQRGCYVARLISALLPPISLLSNFLYALQSLWGSAGFASDSMHCAKVRISAEFLPDIAVGVKLPRLCVPRFSTSEVYMRRSLLELLLTNKLTSCPLSRLHAMLDVYMYNMATNRRNSLEKVYKETMR